MNSSPEGNAGNNAPAAGQLNELVTLFQAGRYAEVEASARTLLLNFPESGFAWNLLGAALGVQGKEALPALQKAAHLLPGDAGVHNNLGNALKSAGQFEAAVASFRRALSIKPDSAELHNSLGGALAALGRPEEAASSFRRAVSIRPDYVEAYNNLGNAQKALGQLEEALASYRQALTLRPGFAEGYYNLGVVWKDLKRHDEAEACFGQALALRPDYAEAHYNLGVVLQDQGQLEGAEASFRRALALRPDFVEALNGLGSLLMVLGIRDEAIASFRRALDAKPDSDETHSRLLFFMNYTADHADASCLEEARRFGRMMSDRVEQRYTEWACEHSPERLRVGVVSGDLRNHPVGFALENVLAALDPARVELYAYPTTDKADDFTEKLRPHFSAWRPLVGLDDRFAAQLIHADGVHVLLDLAGHTGHHRLPMFAWKPAPVQASWLGYFATTGVAEMDYLITSEVAVPKAHQAHFTEQVWYLPDVWLCFTPPPFDLAVTPLPALTNDQLSFGSFQRLDKVGDAVLTAWGRILEALPKARLRWQRKELDDPAVKARVIDRLRRQGVDLARVALHGQAPKREDYFASYNEVDVILDTFPYPGVTTTCEAMWMGVPTVSLAGDTLVSRQGAGVLVPAGLSDWVVSSVDDYVAKAVSLADDISGLARLRAGLRAQVLASPVYDVERFARNFEAALWEMWRTVKSDGQLKAIPPLNKEA